MTTASRAEVSSTCRCGHAKVSHAYNEKRRHYEACRYCSCRSYGTESRTDTRKGPVSVRLSPEAREWWEAHSETSGKPLNAIINELMAAERIRIESEGR